MTLTNRAKRFLLERCDCNGDPLFKTNIQNLTKKNVSPWRKISLGTWRITGDSSVYSSLTLDATRAMDTIKKYNTENLMQNTGKKLTLTSMVVYALAQGLKECPQLNSIIRFGGIYQRQDIDLFVHVAIDGEGEDLSGVVIRKAQDKSVEEIALEIKDLTNRLRMEGDPQFTEIKKSIQYVPTLLLKYILDLLGFFLYSLNLWTPKFNVKRDPFGSAMVTNIGSLGVDQAFVPIPYYSRIPLIISIGALKYAPWVNQKTQEVEVRPQVIISATFDHRIIDGVHGAKLINSLKKYFE